MPTGDTYPAITISVCPRRQIFSPPLPGHTTTARDSGCTRPHSFLLAHRPLPPPDTVTTNARHCRYPPAGKRRYARRDAGSCAAGCGRWTLQKRVVRRQLPPLDRGWRWQSGRRLRHRRVHPADDAAPSIGVHRHEAWRYPPRLRDGTGSWAAARARSCGLWARADRTWGRRRRRCHAA